MTDRIFRWIMGLLIVSGAVSIRNSVVKGAPLPDGGQSTPQATVTLPTADSQPQPIMQTTPSPLPIQAPADASTSTSSVPLLTVREATNCRSGPGTNYQIVITYPARHLLEIVGRDESGEFWLVRSAESPTGSCWMWGGYVDVTGDYAPLPLVAAPATASLQPPQAPAMQRYEYYCNTIENTLSFSLIWQDRSDNEAGYRVYRDGQVIADLPAGTTSYGELIPMPVTRTTDYFVQAHNANGTAEGSALHLTCD